MVSLLQGALPKIKTVWEKWHFFFCDERVVAFDDPESTYGIYKNSLIGAIPVNEDQFVKVNPQLSGQNTIIFLKQFYLNFIINPL